LKVGGTQTRNPLVAAIAIAAIPYARGPPGVAADHWIAMGDAAGFVIADTVNDLRKGLRTDPNVLLKWLCALITGLILGFAVVLFSHL
jgi:hypothetical protein